MTDRDDDRVKKMALAILEALDAPDDPNQEALDTQRDRERSAILEQCLIGDGKPAPAKPRFIGPARSLDEMRFAASLEACELCGARALERTTQLAGQGQRWTLSGTCERCQNQRAFTYATLAEPVPHDRPFELGPGPSQMITPSQLIGALVRALPLIAPVPDTLDADALFISAAANARVLTIVNELTKLIPKDADAIPSIGDEQATRAWLDAERTRQVRLRAAHDAALASVKG